MLTSLAIVISFASTLIFFGAVLGLSLELLIPQLILFSLVLIFLAYFCECKYKEEFFQIKENRRLKNELKHAMGVVPEAIFMYDASTMEVVMANTELEKLVSKDSNGVGNNAID